MADSLGGLPSNVDAASLARTIVEAADVARIGVTITLVDEAVARCVYTNSAAADILGVTADELLATDPLSHVIPEAMGNVRERFARRKAGEAHENFYELPIQRKDGSRRVIEVTTVPVKVGGRPAVFAFTVDVTARREAELARQRTESSFRELFEVAPEPFGIVVDGYFVYANPAYLRMFGYESFEEFRRVAVAAMVQESEELEARCQFILEGGRPPAFAYHGRRRDGSVFEVETSGAACEYEGRPAIFSMARDISARKALETQLIQADRLAAIGTMAAGVAHEINNPLAYLLLNLDWIARKLPESAHDPANMAALVELLHEARAGAERVASIVRELRTFSRADGESRRRVDIASVARSAIKLAGHEIRHRARVTTSFEPAGAVWANESRLEQVVLNLLLNAAHAMPESRVVANEIRVQVRPDGEDGVVLEVADNGEGIPQEILPRIFDPFFTTKPRGVGMGLGLSICHGIVVSLGGRITVHSSSNEGTTFRVALPTTERASSEVESPSDRAPSERGTRARVLVIDDEAPIANTMRELLGAQHDVTATTTVRDALAAVQGRDFDVIFCDLMMPGMSGIDLFEELREKRPELAKRIVFMTGGVFTARAAEFLATTGNRRVEKPFSMGLVERIVREMVVERIRVE